ncbi:TetR/AcrR family transcriptional regulator [Microbacterium sp. ZW T5_56]|uniref:TetR/AcrR family transcriptional regulator n=1 Tax=Microbacterium sp. ZW T5_56 TaxID=3378081 RepID=UPI0038549F81
MTPPTARLPAPQRRALIVDAATDVFVSVGYRAASLRDIAARAGISHTALRRHFASKDEILLAIHEQYEADTLAALADRGEMTVDEWMVALAVEASRDADRLRVFTALVGEGTSPSHPAHDAARRSYEMRLGAVAAGLHRGVGEGVVAADRATTSQAVRLLALWNGAQLLQQYLPEIVHTPQLIRAESIRTRRPAPPRQESDVTSASTSAGALSSGTSRRGGIIDAATSLLLTHGYSDTSMQAFAAAAGIAKGTLFHHYATKDELVRAVLRHSAEMTDALTDGTRQIQGADRLRHLPAQWRAVCTEAADFVSLHVVLSAEASSVGHPLHADFHDHFAELVSECTAAFRDAGLNQQMRETGDPRAEAVRLVSLWEGLLIVSRFDASIDVASEVAAHLDELLVIPAQGRETNQASDLSPNA